jgi:hypothetical protein
MILLDHVGPRSPIRTLRCEFIECRKGIPDEQPGCAGVGAGELLLKLG